MIIHQWKRLWILYCISVNRPRNATHLKTTIGPWEKHKLVGALLVSVWYLFNTLTCYLIHSPNMKMSSKEAAQLFKFPCRSSNCKLDCAIDSCDCAWILVSCSEYELPRYSVFHPSERFTGLKCLHSQEVWIRESPLYPFVVDLCFQHASRCRWISSIMWTSRRKLSSAPPKSTGNLFGGLIY